jgi:putative component of membrane protein insertase Oxa1/YidC/SpoIIIJ protein YidD
VNLRNDRRTAQRDGASGACADGCAGACGDGCFGNFFALVVCAGISVATQDSRGDVPPVMNPEPSSSVPQRGLLALLRTYKRRISPRLKSRCLYEVSCSEYAAAAVVRHGTTKGLRLALQRLRSCRTSLVWGLDEPPQNDLGTQSWSCA